MSVYRESVLGDAISTYYYIEYKVFLISATIVTTFFGDLCACVQRCPHL